MKLFVVVGLFIFFETQAMPLFERYEKLENALPFISLARTPTPLQRCHNLEKILGCYALFIKRDDLTGAGGLYGGNKVRKLEFLLADALEKGAKRIVTIGGVGTNHGLATACYAKQVELDCLLMLKHQPNSPVVQQNLLLDHYFGAKIAAFSSIEERNATVEKLLESSNDTYFIPTGGSTALGTLGYVNAAFELKEQVESGLVPELDYIYVPVGSGGTVAGLLLGCVLAGIQTKIIAVAVEPEETVGELKNMIQKLFFETNQLLNSVSDAIPLFPFPDKQLSINKDFSGAEYGQWLSSGDDAAKLLYKEEGIVLDGTYSAKALAALIADSKNAVRGKDDSVLFWNTYCGTDFSQITSQIAYQQLPEAVHCYFEDAQLIDGGQQHAELYKNYFNFLEKFNGTLVKLISRQGSINV